jgi:long-chain acyl-CoA synthetase
LQVESFLELSAERLPDKIAVVCEDRRLSYRSIEQEANRIAHGLIALGVRRGDRVAIHLENSVEATIAVFAILKAGGVFVLINPNIKAEKLKYVLIDTGARVLVIKDQKLQKVFGQCEQALGLEVLLVCGEVSDFSTSKLIVSWDNLVVRYAGFVEPPPKQCIDLDNAAIIYTSGSTGKPKGVTLTHLNMVAAAESVVEYLENTADDVILNVLPMSFSYGLHQMLTAFKVGATVIIERSFTYPHAVLQRLVDERVTGFAIVPTISAVLLQLDLSQYTFSQLRYMTAAGAAMPLEHVQKLRRWFPQTKLYLMYGLTECKRVCYLPPDQVDRRPTSVGKAMPNVEVYIVDENGERVPPGTIGELVVRGSNVMRGYWSLPEETDKVLKPGPVPGERVLYTGDLFRTDEEGYLYWIGRRDDIIKSGGEKVSPKEVENVLYGLEGVAMAAVVGIRDEILGQIVKAVLTLREGVRLTEKEVLRHCSRHLEDFMVPKLVEFRETMPRTPAGKIDKKELAGQRE